jgi:hypothetical protein
MRWIMLAAVTLGAASVASAAPIAYEGFEDYQTTNDISAITADGGSGWLAGSEWDGANDVTDPGLGGSRKLTTDGSATTSFRSLANSYSTGTVWLSVLESLVSGDANQRWGGLSLFDNGGERLFIGARWQQTTWGLERSGGGGGGNSAVAISDTPAWLVVRIDFNAAAGGVNEVVSLWVNPSSASEPLVGAADVTFESNDFGFNRVRVGSGNLADKRFNFDEIRLGTEWSDVVPEPMTLLLLGAGALATAVSRRRRK